MDQVPANLNSDSESESDNSSGDDSDGEEGNALNSPSGSRESTPTDTLYLHHMENNITNCEAHEICVDGYGPSELWDFDAAVAYCVSTNNFVEIAKEKVAHITSGVNDAGDPSEIVGDITSATEGVGIEVVLTAPDHTSSIYAWRMRIEAQRYGEAFNTHLWYTLPNGTEDCRGCASLDLKPMPEGTKRIKVDVMLSGPGLISGGLLYLFRVNARKLP